MRKCLFLWIAAGCFLLSCKKDTYITGHAILNFSSDSVFFDTVFTETGSITQQIRIINPNDQKLLISNISLAGGVNSPFKLNINGASGPEASGLTLEGNDSLYLFVSVYIPSGMTPAAFILRDSIRVSFNGADRYIQLSAWGQNAHFLKNEIIHGTVSWPNDLPYVISGNLRVDSNSVLIIQPGCRLYFHADAPLLVDGTLLVDGEAADSLRVHFNSDRLDEPNASFPGSWPGIYFSASSTNNHMQYAVLENGYQSLVVLSPATNAAPKLILDQCTVDNSSDAGIIGIQSSINANNCLITNCGKNIEIAGGGSYQFVQCTVASYSNAHLQHQFPVLSISNEGEVNNQTLTGDVQAVFVNCIFWGDNNIADEAAISRPGNTAFQVTFDHIILKQQNYPANTDSTAVLLNTDPLFTQTDNARRLYDFHLQAGSPGAGYGKDAGLPFDLDGNLRIPGKQDLGCYERQ